MLDKSSRDEYPFTCKVIDKRVEELDLPIKFTDAALLAAEVFAEGNPGKAVVFLIDSLNKFEGKTVGLDEICESLYPFGFYTDASLDEYIDGCKDRKYRWSEIY